MFRTACRVVGLFVALTSAAAAQDLATSSPGPEETPAPDPGGRLAGKLRVVAKGRSRECGQLSRKRDPAGGYMWQINGCSTLVDLLAVDQCGNGKLDPGEVCDPSAGQGCSQGKYCGDLCDSCEDSPTPTPPPTPTRTPVFSPGPSATPAPTPTPPVTLAGCPAGSWDVTGEALTQGFGRDWVRIGDGQTHTYCFNLTKEVWKLSIYISDRTGADQCTWGTYTIIPPLGSGLPEYVTVGRGGGNPILHPPLGTWVVRITEATTPNCDDHYQIVFYY